MATYISTRTNERAELTELTDDIAYLRMLDTDMTREISAATLKRWWRPVESEQPEEFPQEENPMDVPSDSLDDQNQSEPIEEAIIQPEPEETNLEALDEPEEVEMEDTDQNEPMKLSEIVEKLESLFDTLNDLYFENSLTRPIITIQSTPKFYGHCSSKKIWKSGVEDEGESYYEINIGAEHLNRPSENTAATMCHEMIHLFCRENDIDETCQKGRYHNKLFKQEAEKRDLNIDYDRAIGYSITAPTDAFTEKLRETGFELTVPFARHTLVVKEHASRKSSHKYVCPSCGQTVRSTSELSLICGLCEEPLEKVG